IYYIKKLFIRAVAKTDRVDHSEAWSDHLYRPPGLLYRKESPGYLPSPAGVNCSNAFRWQDLARFAPGSSSLVETEAADETCTGQRGMAHRRPGQRASQNRLRGDGRRQNFL